MTVPEQPLVLRPLRAEDVDAVIEVWHESKRVAYPYLPLEQARTLVDDREFFCRVILPNNAVWVALVGEEVVGFLAIGGSYVDRLYIHPARQRQGIGSTLIAKAKELSPTGVQLHTHQKNTQARAFYEGHRFHVAKLGISPPPESEPDIEYHWTPATDRSSSEASTTEAQRR